MALCLARFGCTHRSQKNSPVKPCRRAQYSVDRSPSLETLQNSSTSNATVIIRPRSQPTLKRKKAYEGLNEASPRVEPAALGAKQVRESSMQSLLKKAHAIIMRKSSVASFASVFVKAGAMESRSSMKSSDLRHKRDFFDPRTLFEDDGRDGPAARVASEDSESAWVTDDEREY